MRFLLVTGIILKYLRYHYRDCFKIQYMLKKEDIDKIERYIKGESDRGEVSWVESLFYCDGELNHNLRQCLKKDWDIILMNNTGEEYHLSNLLDRIHHLIHTNENSERNKPLHRFMRIYMKAAAVLIIPLIIVGSLLFGIVRDHAWKVADQGVTSTIYAPLGSRVSFILPDSTTGMLNSGSYLTYFLPFNKKRELKLEGEAWFNVKKDEEKPFEIKAGNSIVKVLGTIFNLYAYPTENYVEVVLQEGNVMFQDTKYSNGVLLNSSKRLVYQNGKINTYEVDPEKYNAWTKGKLVFRSEPMTEVIRRLERWYNVKIVVADKELEKYSFRGTFEDDPLEEVLRYLALTSPITFKFSPRIILPDGTYKKDEVTISKKR